MWPKMNSNYFQQLNQSIPNVIVAQTQQVAYYRDQYMHMCRNNEYLQMILKNKDAEINHLQNSKQCIPNAGISRCLSDANFFETKLLYTLIDVLKAHNIDYGDEFEEIERLIHEQKERVNILQSELLKLKLDVSCEKKTVEEVYASYSKCNLNFIDILDKVQSKKIEAGPKVIELETIFENEDQNTTEFDIENGNFDLQTFLETHNNEQVVQLVCQGKEQLDKLKINDSIKSLVYAKSGEIEIFLPTSEAVFLMQGESELDFHNIFNFLDKYGRSSTIKQLTLPSDKDVNLKRDIHVTLKTYHGVDTYEISSLIITANLINSNNFEITYLSNYLAVNEILIERLETDDKELTLYHDLLTMKNMLKSYNPDLKISEKKLVWLRDEAYSLNKSIKTTRYDIFEAVILIFLEDQNYVEKFNLGRLIQKAKPMLNTLKFSNKKSSF